MLQALRRLLFPARHDDVPASLGHDALVQVYLRGEGTYVEHSNRTRLAEAGYWIASGEVTVLAPDAADQALGEVILQALARSRLEVPMPARDAKLEAGLFRAMHVRSRRAAMSGTRSCLVSREPSGSASTSAWQLRIEALHNGGTSGDDRGYSGLPVPVVSELPLASDAETVGRAVRTSLQHATVVT